MSLMSHGIYLSDMEKKIEICHFLKKYFRNTSSSKPSPDITAQNHCG